MEMCRGCKADCCFSFSIPLSLPDVCLLASHGKMKYVRFVKQDRRDANSFRVGTSFYKMYLAKNPTGECAFFDYSRGFGCSIEQYKPSACNAYPLERAYRDTPAELMKGRMCHWAREASHEDMLSWEDKMQDYEKEWSLHRELVARWNKSAVSLIPYPPLFAHVWMHAVKGWLSKER